MKSAVIFVVILAIARSLGWIGSTAFYGLAIVFILEEIWREIRQRGSLDQKTNL